MIAARKSVPFYRERLPQAVESLLDFSRIPILTKADIRQNTDALVADDYNPKHLWISTTSGSTGTPLRFAVGREGIRARFAIQDNYYASFDCHYRDRRVRFGGSKIAAADRRTPPFWILNRPDNQLQMSPYHMDQSTMGLYIRKLNEFRPRYLTGYAHALYILADYLCQHGGLDDFGLKALFLDSEGVPSHYVPVIEQGFRAPVYAVYGIGETGWIAVQEADERSYVLELSCVLEVVDDDGQPVPPGTSGRLIVTDLTQTAVPYIRYDTGDIGRVLPASENRAMHSAVLEAIDGRSDELILTLSGRRVGRLSHVTKPGRGIRESQIVQTAPDHVVIRVVPGERFDPESMVNVIKTARELLGSDMRIEWEKVSSIPRTSRHKFKHVVREF